MEILSFSALFIVITNWRATSPPHVLFSPSGSDRNYEIAILFQIVQRSYNKPFGIDTTRQILETNVVSYTPGYIRFFMEGVVVCSLEEAHLIGIRKF